MPIVDIAYSTVKVWLWSLFCSGMWPRAVSYDVNDVSKEPADLIFRVLYPANCECSQFIPIRNPVTQRCSQFVMFATVHNLFGDIPK